MSDNPKFRIVPNDLLVDQRLAYLYGQLRKLKATPATVSAAATTITNNTLLKREVVSLTTAPLVIGGQQTGSVPLGKTFSLMGISASNPCRVRLYSSADFRAVDIAASRSPSTPPLAFSEHGVVFDWNTQDAPTFTGGTYVAHDTAFGNYLTVQSGTQSLMTVSLSGHPAPAGTVMKVRMSIGYDPTMTGSVFLCDAMGNIMKTVLVGATGNPGLWSSPFVVPVGADHLLGRISFTVGPPDPHVFNQWSVETYQAADAVVSYPDYPITFACSPEALGSDLSAFPAGDIAYAIDNLGDATAPVTVNFEIIREEK